MGASLTMIDRHYGHLARDGREHAIRLLDELSSHLKFYELRDKLDERFGHRLSPVPGPGASACAGTGPAETGQP
jgi:hypothetical protein